MALDGDIEKGASLQVLNRDAIKYIAMLAMALNHIAHVFLTHGTPLYELFEDIGYFTAPVMCFFLAEGYWYASSRVKYGCRLLFFALVSQIPYDLALGMGNLNMIYTLFVCFMILAVMERVGDPTLRMILVMLLMFATLAGDWPLLAPLFTILFHNRMGDRRRMISAYAATYLMFVVLNVQNDMEGAGGWTLYAVGHALLAGAGILVSGMVIMVFYNGKRAERGQTFSKWFFYLFYPAHLLALYAVKTYLTACAIT